MTMDAVTEFYKPLTADYQFAMEAALHHFEHFHAQGLEIEDFASFIFGGSWGMEWEYVPAEGDDEDTSRAAVRAFYARVAALCREAGLGVSDKPGDDGGIEYAVEGRQKAG